MEMEIKAKITESEIRNKLRKFRSSDEYFLHRLSDNWTLYLTEGCFFIREMANAYWLFDLILSYQGTKLVSGMEHQEWKVRSLKSGMLQISCISQDNEEIIIQVIKKKKFPLDEISIHVEGNIARLPTEG